MVDPKATMTAATEAFQTHLAAVREQQDAMRSRDRTKWETSWRELDARVDATEKAYKAICADLSTAFEQVFGVHPMNGLGHIRF